ncbi:MAG: hypothetical protein Q8R04_03195 [Nanoarchaeota archaeon]|nr:hypothetical protein [Nanoarchaeota archaeon]
MNEQQELQRFMENKPDVEQLRRQYPDLRGLLVGEFGKRNVYQEPEGTVVSWDLVQGDQRRPEYARDPTYGRIPKGHFEFPTDHREELTVLEGTLAAEVNGRNLVANKLEKIVAPPGSLLKLDAIDRPVFYFCEYMKSK